MRAVGLAILGAALAFAVIAAPSLAGPAGSPSGPLPAVFTMTNSASGNQIVEFERATSGTLTWVANFSTGGTGTGASLADQGSLALTSNHQWLLVVDAGSNQVSVLKVGQSGGLPWLTLTDVVGSGGLLPVSIAIHDDLVFVLNDGSSISQGDIAGFTLASNGHLHPIAGSTQALSTSGATGAAQISFNPAGTLLAVTEKTTSLIDVYAVSSSGVTHPAISHASQGSTPYGFAFSPSGTLVVSEAGPGSLSSYSVGPHGFWHVDSSSVTDFQGAPCWVVVSLNGAYAYTTNAHSNTISSYTIGPGGRLTLLQAVAASTGATPTDEALTSGGHLLYVYDAGSGQIEGFGVHSDGTLVWETTVGGLVPTAEGLVAI